jgi:hypothetical protein
MKSHINLVAALLSVAAVAAAAQGQGVSRKYGELLKRLPDQANVLLLVDAENLFQTPMGRREKWQQQARERPNGVLGLRGDMSKIAVAMSLDIVTLDERWKLGMVETPSDPPEIARLAAREGGYVERIQNQNVAWTPQNLFLFSFPDRIIGFAAPADRQFLSSWLLNTIVKPRTFPPSWADRAIHRADAGIVLALDLRDTISPMRVGAWLKSTDNPSIKRMVTNAEVIAASLASARSAFLQIDVDQAIQGSLRVEFDSPIDAVKAIGKELVLQTLDDQGANITELRTWSANVESKSITLSGRLSEDSVRRILSVVATPALDRTSGTSASRPSNSTPKSAATPNAEPAQDVALKASQAYFRSVVDIAETLMKRKGEAQTSLKLWYDRSAKQIEELPLLHVDIELLDWGSEVAKALRGMSHGIYYTAKDQTHRIAGTSNGYYGGYGYGYGNSKGYDATVIKKQSNAVLTTQLDVVWQQLETSIADMRKKMVLTYKADS